MPWLSWTAVGLLVALVLLALVGKVLYGTPWWVRLGLVGALACAWSKYKRTSTTTHGLPSDHPLRIRAMISGT